MRCPSTEQLVEYQMKMLSPQREALVHEHLRGCARCQQEMAMLDATNRLLDTTPAPAMPTDLWPDIAARLPDRPQRSQQWWWKMTAMAGVTASLLYGGLFYYQQQRQPMPVAPAMTASYVTDHRFLAAQEPLADRASLGVALTAYGSERE